jgi:hypothetical protein
MNREDIIKLALECQFAHYYESGDLVAMPQLERFAALVAAHEREACAKVVEDYCGAWDDEGYALATAIRARG